MPFKKGQSGNPAGRPNGAKDHFPRSARAAVQALLERLGGDTALIGKAWRDGVNAKAPSSFPYLRLLVEQQVGLPDQNVNVATTVIHEHRASTHA